jgi:hypothetical protein
MTPEIASKIVSHVIGRYDQDYQKFVKRNSKDLEDYDPEVSVDYE